MSNNPLVEVGAAALVPYSQCACCSTQLNTGEACRVCVDAGLHRCGFPTKQHKPCRRWTSDPNGCSVEHDRSIDWTACDPSLLVGVWFQVSRKHRTVARFPWGVEPREALIEARLATYDFDRLDQLPSPNDDFESVGDYWRAEIPRWANALCEGSAGDHFLRVYAQKPELWMEMPNTPAGRERFAAYRKAGGDTFRASHYRTYSERRRK